MVNRDRSGQRTSESWLTRLFRRFHGDGKRSKSVRLGDRFGKIGELFEGTQTTWQVWQTVDFVNMPHVKLIQEEPPHRVVTVSLSTLLDKRFYRRLAPAVDVQSTGSPAATDDTGGIDERQESPSRQGPPEPVPESFPKVDQTRDTTSNDDIIRFLDPETREAVPKTNPFSKARIGKRRTETTASRITH